MMPLRDGPRTPAPPGDPDGDGDGVGVGAFLSEIKLYYFLLFQANVCPVHLFFLLFSQRQTSFSLYLVIYQSLSKGLP